MIGRIGVPELFIILFVSLTSLVPIAVGVWLILSVVRLRSTVQSVETKVDSLLRERRPS